MVGSSLFASLTAKIAIAAAAATAAASGLAAAGALPAPVQQVAANVASSVGLDIPGGAPSQPGVTGTDHDGDHPDVTETEKADVTETEDADVTGTVKGDDHEGDVTETATPSHGACVSFAAHEAESLGFEGSQKGAFVSAVAQDPTAVSLKVGSDSEADGKPDAACQSAIDKAKAALSAASPKKHGDDQGTDEQGNADHDDHAPTSTVTSGDDHHEGTVSGTVTSSGVSHSHHD